MNILLVTPGNQDGLTGNKVTTKRWTNILQELGHTVTVSEKYTANDYDIMIAIHARRSHDAIRQFSTQHPERPLVVALAGTDLYRDYPDDTATVESIRSADRLVVLQSKATERLPEEFRPKVRVVHQSLPDPPRPQSALDDCFEVCVVGHLREVKDPFRAAKAVRDIPENSRIQITHLGHERESGYEARAQREMSENDRYKWLGGCTRNRTLRILDRSRIMVISSLMEGGANVVSESIVTGTPVIASNVPGNVGLLGDTYGGYFPAKDTEKLRKLLLKAENNKEFYERLENHVASLQELFTPEREKEDWDQLLVDVM